jgi:hypothetical protein
MLLMCAVQAVSFVWTAIFRHRATPGPTRKPDDDLRIPLARLARPRLTRSTTMSLAGLGAMEFTMGAATKMDVSLDDLIKKARPRPTRLRSPNRRRRVVPWSRPLAARVPIRPNSDVRPPPSSSILRRATGEEGAESREEEGAGAFTSRPLPPRRAIRSRRATRSSSRSGEFSSFIQFVRRTNYSALLRVRSNDSLTPPSSHLPAAPLAPLPAA